MDPYRQLSREELVRRLEALEHGAGELDQRLAEAALSDSEERLRAIFDTAVEGILTIDEGGLIESMNPAAEKIFGAPAKNLIGQNINVLMPQPYKRNHDRYLANYLRTGHAKIIGIGREVVGQRRDGSVFPMDLSVGEVRLSGRRLFTGIVRDITERKQLEKEIIEISDREQRRVGQDLHDGLCQHLAGIELFCQSLEEDLMEQAPEKAVQAREIARHVRDAITQTRGLAHGLSPIDLDSDGLPNALRELAVNIENFAKVRCRVVLDETVSAIENSVATHLYRIVQEATHNALRHGKATDMTINLHRRDSRIELRITDNGSGLPEPPRPASGMGLRIMRFRAGMIGGTLDLGRGEEGGTMVVCQFPAQA